ncbi:putative phage abortive infection protein [Erwinia pyri]|uniref:Phage abortive infection protein n=1 Tax=Erwinia pyri TaxID=3062598 RepID=A0AA50DHU9_9GAMM|nr:putative phage abortive infection protein [Erwinia sp. DE2]WLS77237.1 putative phage abortive infection protein [Erwinia sp. DE2]
MRKRLRLLLAMLSIFILIVVYYFCALTDGIWPFNGIDKDSLGTFGDSWGMLTSIFSVLAFLGVSYSLIMQAEAFKHSESFTQKQVYFTTKQSFENNLFQMLSLLQDVISAIHVRKVNPEEGEDPVRQGRSSFKLIYELTVNDINKKVETRNYESLSDMYIHINESYSKQGKHIAINLGHYFRFLYNIFKYIYESDIKDCEKLAYAKIVRAQISNYELLLLFYNIFDVDGIKFEKYIYEYSIFDNMPINKLMSKYHVLLLDPIAFGENTSYNPKDLLREFNQLNNILAS